MLKEKQTVTIRAIVFKEKQTVSIRQNSIQRSVDSERAQDKIF
jgi:hypothetical protein